MLLDVMKYCNNYFIESEESGKYEILNNAIELQNDYTEGQYIIITGSRLNNDLYKIKQYEDSIVYLDDVNDEIFEGIIYGLVIPKPFLKLVDEISEYIETNENSNIVSYSFGNYSETRAVDKNGNIMTWESAFYNRLYKYRRMFDPFQGVI